MSDKFFRIVDNAELEGRWWLKSPCELNGKPINPELFCDGKLLDFRPPLTISIRHDGKPIDWTFADFEMPVVSKRTVTLLRNICEDDFQSFTAIIEGYGDDFKVLNFLKTFQCLDEKKSDILFWTKEDERLDKIGQYRQIVNMRIDSSRVRDANIFRIAGWEIALIVSKKIKDEFLKEKITGVQFVEV
jgi:hypothetical protein